MPEVNPTPAPHAVLPNVTLAEVVVIVGYLARALADATVGTTASTTPTPDYATAMADVMKAVSALGLNLASLKFEEPPVA